MPDNNPRNLAARSPYMRKGGAHQKSTSAVRRQHKLVNNDMLDDYLEYLEDKREHDTNNEESNDSSFAFH